jgi:hypothetical protein
MLAKAAKVSAPGRRSPVSTWGRRSQWNIQTYRNPVILTSSARCRRSRAPPPRYGSPWRVFYLVSGIFTLLIKEANIYVIAITD